MFITMTLKSNQKNKRTLQDNNVQQIITIPIFSNHIQLAAQSGMGRNVRIERITHV